MDFTLPPEISMTKETLPGSSGWAFVFRHATMGELGRLILQGRPDGQSQIACEVTGSTEDPMTAERQKVLEPITRRIVQEIEKKACGGQPGFDVPPPDLPKDPGQLVESELIRCETCETNVAMVVFSEATDVGGMEDSARLMYNNVRKMNVPTWIVGELVGEDALGAPVAYVLKVWPERGEVEKLPREDLHAQIEPLEKGHCFGT